jgi:hypothetical protein
VSLFGNANRRDKKSGRTCHIADLDFSGNIAIHAIGYRFEFSEIRFAASFARCLALKFNTSKFAVGVSRMGMSTAASEVTGSMNIGLDANLMTNS